MMAAWCFQCGLDYAPDVAECVECGVPTVGHPPSSLDGDADTDEAHLAYELHAWNGLARVAVEEAMYQAHLAHAWQGPTLLVREVDEAVVDDIIEVVDDSMPTDASAGVETEGGRVGFDLGARNGDLQELVSAKLTAEGVEFEVMANGFLLVPTELEDTVGDWVEAIQAQLRGTDTFGPGVAGVDAHAVVEAMFIASDSLRRNCRDTRSQRELLDNASLAHDLKLPFGYEAPMWRGMLDQAAVLSALIEDAGDDAMIESEALRLRDILHPYV
jgi:hypothetical protein